MRAISGLAYVVAAIAGFSAGGAGAETVELPEDGLVDFISIRTGKSLNGIWDEMQKLRDEQVEWSSSKDYTDLFAGTELEAVKYFPDSFEGGRDPTATVENQTALTILRNAFDEVSTGDLLRDDWRDFFSAYPCVARQRANGN